MKCPVCLEKDLQSKVFPQGMACTLLYCAPYYDEDGKYHNHDSNTSTYSYSCSHGHRWTVSSTGKCSSCDFGSDSEIISIISDEEVKPISMSESTGSFILASSGTSTLTVPGFGSNTIIISGTGISSGSSATLQFLTLTK